MVRVHRFAVLFDERETRQTDGIWIAARTRASYSHPLQLLLIERFVAVRWGEDRDFADVESRVVGEAEGAILVGGFPTRELAIRAAVHAADEWIIETYAHRAALAALGEEKDGPRGR